MAFTVDQSECVLDVYRCLYKQKLLLTSRVFCFQHHSGESVQPGNDILNAIVQREFNRWLSLGDLSSRDCGKQYQFCMECSEFSLLYHFQKHNSIEISLEELANGLCIHGLLPSPIIDTTTLQDMRTETEKFIRNRGRPVSVDVARPLIPSLQNLAIAKALASVIKNQIVVRKRNRKRTAAGDVKHHFNFKISTPNLSEVGFNIEKPDLSEFSIYLPPTITRSMDEYLRAWFPSLLVSALKELEPSIPDMFFKNVGVVFDILLDKYVSPFPLSLTVSPFMTDFVGLHVHPIRRGAFSVWYETFNIYADRVV